MKFSLPGILVLLFAGTVQGQLLNWTPEFVFDNSSVTITMDASLGNQGLLGHTASDVYVHTGVITNLSATPSSWRYVKFNQNFTQPNPSLQATKLAGPGNENKWSFTINNIRSYYGVPAEERIIKIAILFRSGNGGKVQRNADGSDMYIPISLEGTLDARISSPRKEPKFLPTLDLCKQVGDLIPIVGQSTSSADLKLYYNNVLLASANGTSVNADLTIAQAGPQQIVLVAKQPLGAVSTTYTFNGNGNWTNSANWANGQVPPDVVGGGSEVVINPSPGGNCVLNKSQTFINGGKLTLASNAHLIVQGSLQNLTNQDELGTVTIRDTVEFFVAAATVVEALPAGVAANGVTYHNGGTAATLVLYAPNKSNVVVVGDFNNWSPTLVHQMKRTPDGLRYWVRIEGLTPGQEYAYQYRIDCNLRVADYNTEKVLDPWNDQYINQDFADRYPNLKPYPAGKATGIVSVLEPGKPTYNWGAASLNFQRPDKRNIVVYELLVRDFLKRSDWKTLRDTLSYISRLGVNTIHLMPFNEFEGNNSWGYNPSFMFAVDKFYGPENQLREFIDSCHGRGIAVVMDMVLNHQFGLSPLVQMYWDAANSRPAANNPWVNPAAKHAFNVGYDLNHEAPATIEFVERVMQHWLVKYKLDGFRWDLSKGFTQTQTCDASGNNCNAGTWSNYDQSRVNIWQRIYNQSQAISPNAYMILEHLGVDQEEATLANMGMLLWGKMTNEYNQASMGYVSDSDFGRAFHTTRWSAYGGNNTPHLMTYAESHDEERLAYKNAKFGNNANGNHNTRNLSVYTRRLQAVAAFLFTVPGPKLMWQFGELAYDSSINMCENFTTSNDCRTAPKPPAWAMPTLTAGVTQDYNASSGGNFNFRRPLRNAYSRIISLRTKVPQYLPAFVTNDVDYSFGSVFKYQRIKSNALNIVVIGNFDVFDQNGSVPFPVAGNWQVFAHNMPGGTNFAAINPNLSATTLSVANTSPISFAMPPGTFLLLVDRDALSQLPQ